MDPYKEYVRHAERAAYLASADGAYDGEFAEPTEALATAQIHATLAVAHATALLAPRKPAASAVPAHPFVADRGDYCATCKLPATHASHGVQP